MPRSGHQLDQGQQSAGGDRLEAPPPRHFYPHGEGDRRLCSLPMEKEGDRQWGQS